LNTKAKQPLLAGGCFFDSPPAQLFVVNSLSKKSLIGHTDKVRSYQKLLLLKQH